jgi:hypothetical protein
VVGSHPPEALSGAAAEPITGMNPAESEANAVLRKNCRREFSLLLFMKIKIHQEQLNLNNATNYYFISK